MKAAISRSCWSPFAIGLLFLTSACSSAGNEKVAENQAPAAQATKAVDARFVDFTVAEGNCPLNDSMTVELSDGISRRFPVVSAYAQPGISITSMQGDVVTTRAESGFTLYIADYPLDPADLGANPSPDQAKLEFTFITQDKTPIAPGIYRKQKDNLAVGPNLFYGGRAYPMKNNFVGGVNISKVDDQHFCGEIRLKSKYEVVVIGNFQAEVLALPNNN